VAEAITYWYNMSKELRSKYGTEGYKWVTGNESNMSARRMGDRMKECIDACFENWTPRKRFSLFHTNKIDMNIKNSGVIA